MRPICHRFLLVLIATPPSAAAQDLGPLDRERAHLMLQTVQHEIEHHYYDTTFHGVDLRRQFASADSQLARAVNSGQLFGTIARAVLQLNDSHTVFYPPERTASVRYGWRLQMIGDSCYVTGVAPGSDAAAQHLRVGDRVLSVEGIVPVPESFRFLGYAIYSLAPRTSVRLSVVSPEGQQRDLTLSSRFIPSKSIIDLTGHDGGGDVWDLIRQGQNWEETHKNQFIEFSDRTLLWKLRTFNRDESIDEGIGKARNFQNLVLDLRGNSGGAEDNLMRLIGRLLDHDVVVDTLHRRGKVEPKIARSASNHFTGNLIVLVDSRSASASEILARLIQLEGRGVVIGDHSAGAVMRSRYHPEQVGTETAVLYGITITDADVVMRDGGRLEGIGITPDVTIMPSASDLAAGRDPVLSAALLRVGLHVDPTRAGTMFPPNPREADFW